MKLPLLLALCATLPAHAFDAACAPYVKASEKTSAQAARHQVISMGADLRTESIIKDGQMYMQVNGKWMKGPPNFFKMEKEQYADLKSGKIKLSDCKKLGRETVDGIATTVYSLRTEIPGMPVPKDPAKIYIGDDGLIQAQSGEGYKIRIRYTGVVAPKL